MITAELVPLADFIHTGRQMSLAWFVLRGITAGCVFNKEILKEI